MGLTNDGVPMQNMMVHVADPNQNLMEIGKNENLLDLDFDPTAAVQAPPQQAAVPNPYFDFNSG